ncbi:hypothetical protein ACHWQZ_G010176 [Mnemiopsis leidyi]
MQTETIRPDQTLSDYLWQKTVEYQNQSLHSNFISGLVAQCLDPSQFGGYLVDDAVYCYEVSQSLKVAAGRSNDDKDLQKFLESSATNWFEYWKEMKEIWHIENRGGVRLGDAASKYVNHIQDVAESEIPVYTIIALIPCAKLWPWLGQKIGSGTNNFGIFSSWVKANLIPESVGYQKYEEFVQRAYEAGKVTADKALDIFKASIKHEVDFFNSVNRCHFQSAGRDEINSRNEL